MKRKANRTITLVAASLLFVWTQDSVADEPFIERVAPILERRCLSCHDDTQRKGGFSLQTADSAFEDGYIEKDEAESSYLVDLITPLGGKAEMPKNADPLSEEEIETIRTWIDAGANWPTDVILSESSVRDFDWWSYMPLQRPEVPEAKNSWVRTPIDAFIFDRMKQKGLGPAAEADRRTLIRRLTYDLTGLPPTPEEVDAFLSDEDPKAYENVVDRLLESKRYGERWARHWLDVVAYADSCGYDKDKLRQNAWPYRDYVIRSFNDDKPYTRFVQEQIAGDVLFPGESDGILGLGFIAAGPWDFIGHVEVPESKIDGKVARNLDRDDMVSRTINAFSSLSVQCARCHNHKFDPITQEHYYGLQAIFAAVDRADRPYDIDPQADRRRRKLESKLQSLQEELGAIDEEIADAGGPRLAELETQIEELQAKQQLKKSPEFGYHSQIANADDTEKWVEVDLGQQVQLSRLVLRPAHDDFAGIGAGFGFPIRYKVEISVDGEDWKPVGEQTEQDVPNPNLSPVEINHLDARGDRIRVTATKLAERRNDYIFALAEIQAFDGEGRNVALGSEVTSLDSIEAPVRWSRKNLTDGQWPETSDRELADRLAAAVKERSGIEARIETPERIERRESVQEAIKETQTHIDALPDGKLVYAAATHFPQQGNFQATEGEPRAVHVLHRGEVQQPLDHARPGALPLGNEADWQFDGELSEDERRAALAHWLTDDEHPLAWRSIVNRVWQYHFGQGIVATPNDFGRMGAEPTHPELLDWLATEFRDGGQSFKALHRLIVTSSVYRQSSQHDEANAAIDGSNQFLWKMSRRRLDAEEIRDSILTVSGAMNWEMGGPGFYLFELEKTEHSPHYEYRKFDPTDPASHRRSIYRFVARSQPNPWMTTLDCADSSQSTPRRNETLTSLQALSLLNNQFNLVMAQRFAERLKKDLNTLPEQIDRAVRLIIQRSPEPSERDELTAYARSHGLQNLCRMLFNLSEFVYLD